MQCLWCIVKHEQRKPFLQCLCLYSRPSGSRGSSSVAERLCWQNRPENPVRNVAGSLAASRSQEVRKQQQVLLVDKKAAICVLVSSWPHECEVPLRNLYTAANAHNVFTDQRKEREGTWKKEKKRKKRGQNTNKISA